MPDKKDESYATAKHRVEGVELNTVVRCPETEKAYGPGTVDPTEPRYCPYCSGPATDGSHRLATRFDEVFCDKTTMSTWRYCPGCGAEIPVSDDAE